MKLTQSIYHWYFSHKGLPYWGVLLFEMLLVLTAEIAVYWFENYGLLATERLAAVGLALLLGVVAYGASFLIFGTHRGIIRYSTIVDLQRVVIATTTASVLLYFASLFLRHTWLEGRNIRLPMLTDVLMIYIIVTMMILLERISVKALFASYRRTTAKIPVFIYGVRNGGVALAQSIQNQDPQQYKLVGFISPFGDLETKYLMGVKVRRIGPNLIRHMNEVDCKTLMVSPQLVEQFRHQRELIDTLIANNIAILMSSEAEHWDGKSQLRTESLHQVEIEDLLPRAQIEVDMQAISQQLKGKCILITGAAGSIGSEIVRQVASFEPRQLVLIDQAETPMHDLQLMLERDYASIATRNAVGTITNREYMESLFAEYHPEYVFHAAAYKHVPMMEYNPAIAVQNNVYGTRVMADLAVKYGVDKFVMVSTDKAVNPTNVMGCSKRICEIYCQSLNAAIVAGEVQGKTQFVTTRFGNVLGSNGSVIPLFREQIKHGGPVTVTHPDIIRFFMLIPEACKLVLEASVMGNGGEIFVFDMGEPVRIADLAQRMIDLSGAKDIEIKYTGLRDGEKLYEEVLAEQEDTLPTVHPKIMRATVRQYPYAMALQNEERLLALSHTYDNMAIVRQMKQIVPEYRSRHSQYEVLDQPAS